MINNSKLFVVLCLHRSGSSATAGVMHQLGIHMGDQLLGANRYNRKGHFENVHIVQLNEQILKSVNASWQNPPTRERILSSPVSPFSIEKTLNSQRKGIWGFKDPRTVLTFEVLYPHLKKMADVTYVFVYRPFLSSVKSLSKRNNIGSKEVEKILQPYWDNLHYYRNSFGLNKDRIIDINYEELLNDPTSFVAKLNHEIGNEPKKNLQKVLNFLEKRLKNF